MSDQTECEEENPAPKVDREWFEGNMTWLEDALRVNIALDDPNRQGLE